MKRILVFLATILASFSLFTAAIAPAEVRAAESANSDSNEECDKGFLGFAPWYRGLTEKKNGRCEVKSPKNSDEIPTFVIKIILNILADLSLAVGYLSLGFIIYGGYLYIMSSGDPGKAAKGKKTLMAAVIGTAIAMLASVIMNLIVGALTS
ncbi:hypothetical protein IJJ18_01505 [Candidatus Saccharibacteria bacterium]|nr:hypothetical protein [Candidatus Saccharibacteria bacterium]